MISDITAPIFTALLMFSCFVAILRCLVLFRTVADRRINVALLLFALCCLLRRSATMDTFDGRAINGLLADVLQTLGEVLVIPAAGAMFLLAIAWLNRAEPAYLPWAVYGSAAMCAGTIFVLTMLARVHAPAAMHDAAGWAVMAYSNSPTATLAALAIHDTLIYWFAAMILYICVQEVRRGPPARAVAICVALAIMAAGALVQTASISIAAILAINGERDVFIGGLGRVGQYTMVLYAYLFALVAAVPLAGWARQGLHMDKYSLRRRRLMPLWRDLTSACPEIKHLAAAAGGATAGSAYLLHRTVVEIRDAVLILARYADRADATAAAAVTEAPAERLALRLALAWSAKSCGRPAIGDVLVQRSAANELLAESDELAAVAAYWTSAKRWVAAAPVSPPAATR
jgi:hypothetical protein